MDFKPEEIYKKEILYEKKFILVEEVGIITITDGNILEGFIKPFWEDNNIQEMSITSTNIGMTETFTKQYLPK